jgi:NADPH:quinone reductase-like Zn-dependent oxidoreductase
VPSCTATRTTGCRSAGLALWWDLVAVADGDLDVRIGHRYPLHEARAAHEDLHARRTTGKVVLTLMP